MGRGLKKVREQPMQISGGRTFQAEEIAKEASVSGVEEEMDGQSEGKDRRRRALWAILGPWLWIHVRRGAPGDSVQRRA